MHDLYDLFRKNLYYFSKPVILAGFRLYQVSLTNPAKGLCVSTSHQNQNKNVYLLKLAEVLSGITRKYKNKTKQLISFELQFDGFI